MTFIHTMHPNMERHYVMAAWLLMKNHCGFDPSSSEQPDTLICAYRLMLSNLMGLSNYTKLDVHKVSDAKLLHMFVDQARALRHPLLLPNQYTVQGIRLRSMP